MVNVVFVQELSFNQWFNWLSCHYQMIQEGWCKHIWCEKLWTLVQPAGVKFNSLLCGQGLCLISELWETVLIVLEATIYNIRISECLLSDK